MPNVSGRTDNDGPVIWGVSHLDGVTPVQVMFDPVTRAMKVDAMTAIAFDPSVDASVVPSNTFLAMATSSADDSTIRPWVVNASTGAVLIDD